ncbi:kti12, chromatin associated [Cladochytrium tenue]|nr:kti12, chromatin associated [Cladochytrium tenue]
MPLVVMVGLPASGKTTRARELARELASLPREGGGHGGSGGGADGGSGGSGPDGGLRIGGTGPDRDAATDGAAALTASPTALAPANLDIVIINEESLGLVRAEAYADANEEKKTRGALLSAVERALSKDTVVFLDSMNYIKGFRYQLHCIAKNLGTTQCTIFCICPPADCETRNAARATDDDAYPPAVLASLLTRLEEPDARHRWDSPLLTLLPDDVSGEAAARLADLLWRPAHRPAPNQSVATRPLAHTNYVHEADAAVRAVVTAVSAAAASTAASSAVAVPGTTVRVSLPPRAVPPSELARLRRQFAAQTARLDSRLSIAEVATAFAEYLNTNLR